MDSVQLHLHREDISTALDADVQHNALTRTGAPASVPERRVDPHPDLTRKPKVFRHDAGATDANLWTLRKQ